MESENNFGIRLGKDCLTLVNSYSITSHKVKEILLGLINTKVFDIYKYRSKRSLINEWKVHNAFYRRGWFKDRTKDTDFQLMQKKQLNCYIQS